MCPVSYVILKRRFCRMKSSDWIGAAIKKSTRRFYGSTVDFILELRVNGIDAIFYKLCLRLILKEFLQGDDFC